MIRTDDIFLGAFLLVRGSGELVSVEVRGINGRRLAFFRIAGPDMEQVERDYHRPVLVDLRLIKAEVARLKNLAFEALREEESRHAREQRRDRPHQGSERTGFGRR